MAYHPRATPNFRNLVVRPMWTTLRAALRTVPIIGPRFFSTGYHSKKAQMLDEETKRRIGEAHSDGIQFAADRETSHFVKSLSRPVTVMYPYERLEDLEPWLFVPGNYNGRIGLFGRPAPLARLVSAPVLMIVFTWSPKLRERSRHARRRR